jgi:hypothetical protein
MRLLPGGPFKIFNLVVLRLASFMIPRHQRAEWLKEWQAELWHVRQTYGAEDGVCWQTEQQVAAFCAGAFQDAFYLRQHVKIDVAPRQHQGSAARYLLFLAGLATVGYCCFMLLPGVRAVMRPSPYRDARNLMLITRSGFSGTSSPTIRIDQFRAWQDQKQHLFSAFAFYRPVVKAVTLAPHHLVDLSIAQSSQNLFELLGLPIRSLQSSHDSDSKRPKLIVTAEAAQRYFGGDRQAVGQTIEVGLRRVEIVGIVPTQLWKLPGKVDAWLLEPDRDASAIPPNAMGFLVGHLEPSIGHDQFSDRWDMSVPTGQGDTDNLVCSTLSRRAGAPFGVFLFAVIVAFLALPATISLPLGEYSISTHKLSWSKRFLRWIYLATKIALIFPIVYFTSMDLAHLSISFTPETSEWIQLVTSFSICLFALRWALKDQRKRCPVCLGRLTHPARVGQPSRTFLAWNGTELMCAGGHGLLHVPELPTSWFGTQRWLYLDSSWNVLFKEAHLAPPGIQ